MSYYLSCYTLSNMGVKTRKVYTKKDYNSGDGMLTSVWGPSLWHYLHTMSFNYPVNPTKKEKNPIYEFYKEPEIRFAMQVL